MPILELTSRERSELRSAAHPLRPVVLIGDNGLSEAVLKEIDLALTSHGLIKVRVSGEDRGAREAMLATICDTLSCAPVHHLGKTLILYRRQPGNVSATTSDATPKRKATEPYTPKKLAAEGKRVTKTRAPRRSNDDDAATAARPARDALQAGRPQRPSTRKSATASHGVPRRAGSALSLRAGARRTTGPARKTSRTVKK